MLKLRTIGYNALIWALYLTSGWTNHSVAESLVVAYNHDWAPYSYLSESGNLQGILPHLTDRLIEEANAGLKVTKVGLPWNRVQQTVLRNQADAFITFASEERLQFADTIGPVFYALEQHPVTRLEEAERRTILSNRGWAATAVCKGIIGAKNFTEHSASPHLRPRIRAPVLICLT